MRYLVNFNVIKKSIINGVEKEEIIPITYIANNVNSKADAFRAAREANIKYFNGEYNIAQVKNLEIKRIPEDAPVLIPDYYQLYKEILLGIGNKLNQGDRVEVKGKDGRPIYISKTTMNEYGELLVTVSDGTTKIFYVYSTGEVAFKIKPDYMYNSTTLVYNKDYISRNECIEARFSTSHSSFERSNKELLKLMNAFFTSVPMFSYEELKKMQKNLEKKHEIEFHQEQLKIIAEDEEIERLLFEEYERKKGTKSKEKINIFEETR